MFDSLLWYSRYSVWVGAIVLFIQSLTGRSVGVISLLGVLLLAAGLAVFLGALSWEGVLETAGARSPELAAVEPDVVAPAPDAPAAEPPVEPAATARDTALQTQRLATDSPLVGASCAVCGKRLRAEQVIVRCPECAAVQHASCWTENGFACAVEGCTGQGSLRAPS